MRKRGRWWKVRLTDDEHGQLRRQADAAGVTVSELVRKRLGELPPPRGVRRVKRTRRLPDDVQAALLPLAQVGNLLNQLARWQHYHQEPLDALRVLLALRETWGELEQIRRILLALARGGTGVGVAGEVGEEADDARA